MLGWTVNGPLGGRNDVQEKSDKCEQVMKLDELWQQQFKNNFPECIRDDQEPSKEDRQFLDLVSKSAQLINGHYCIALP